MVFRQYLRSKRALASRPVYSISVFWGTDMVTYVSVDGVSDAPLWRISSHNRDIF
jgi:hypothetical protein